MDSFLPLAIQTRAVDPWPSLREGEKLGFLFPPFPHVDSWLQKMSPYPSAAQDKDGEFTLNSDVGEWPQRYM